MAKPCTFETYLADGDPSWCCDKPSTKQISEDVAKAVNEYWERFHQNSFDEKLFVIYTDLCNDHAKLANEVYNNITKSEEVKDEMHVQVDQT